MDIGFQEIFLIAIVGLLVYGGELPKVMRQVGRMVGSVKRSFQEGTRDMTSGLDLSGEIHDAVREVRRIPEAIRADRPAPKDVATEDVSQPPPSKPPEAE